MELLIDDEQKQTGREQAAGIAVADGIKRARARYAECVAEVGDRGPAGFVWASLPLDDGNRPIIGVLQRRKLGEIRAYPKPRMYRVWIDEIVPLTVQNMMPAEDACQHFVDRLEHAGFTAQVDSQID